MKLLMSRVSRAAKLLFFGLTCSLAILQADLLVMAQETADAAPKSKIDSGLLSALKLRSIGPALTSGRIADVAVDQQNPNCWYVAAGSGNVWKTTNAGTTFQPIFDNYGSYSIGCVTVDPTHSHNVWIGTGENVGGRHIGFGDGVYVSHDSGQSFTNTGLKNSEHLSKIIVHPQDSDVVFVASQGPLWSSGGDRGLFKTTDGGKSWKNVLSRGEWTGVTDVVLDHNNPNILYAATHQRHRTVWTLLNTGPESGIHKSTDGGETWSELKSGIPGGDKGKIGLQISPQRSNVVYATIELPGRKGGFFRSDDFGNSWTKRSDFVPGGTGPHYYQEIFCDPHRFDVIYQADVHLGRSADGGKTWERVSKSSKHVDNHAVAFHPNDRDFLLVGCDGGLYRSADFGKSYEYFANLPLTQFYKVDVDYDFPFYHVVGGTQDNNSQYGPTDTGTRQGIRNSDWRITIGGDGHDNAIDPTDPNIIYCESQQGHLARYDRRTGESIGIQPQPGKGEVDFRFNWDSPILISPHDPQRLYFGSEFLHRSDDRGDSWRKVSTDLSRDNNRFALKVMGRVWSIDTGFDLFAMSQYGNITSISESPLVEGLIYVGTDDGLIQVTEDGGKNWRKTDHFFGVPEYAFVNDVKADKHDPDIVYAALDHHKSGDYQPYLIKSLDRGRTWSSFTGDLPERHLCWRIEQDHENKDLFFVGTEFGLFVSLNAGEKWIKVSGAPTIPFRDLAIQKRENDLVGATFGRSFYVLDDYSPLRELSSELIEGQSFHLFPIRNALWYIPANHLGGTTGSQGDGFFHAESPKFGATLTYYVKESTKTAKQKRQEKEKTIRKAGGDVPVASWEQLRAEDEEVADQIYFEITNKAGELVARVEADASAGLHRSNWNLRHNVFGSPRSGPLVRPGAYVVQAYRRSNDELTKMGESQSLKVVSIVDSTLKSQPQGRTIQFLAKVAQLQDTLRATKQTVDEASKQVEAAVKAIDSSTLGTPELQREAHEMQLALKRLAIEIDGDPILESYSEHKVPSIGERLSRAFNGPSGSTYGVTKTHREQFEIAILEYGELSVKVNQRVDRELKKFLRKLDAVGIPWSMGRPIPKG
jgi:photosystem II stability/assembly factor-like uncharacterized protein